MFRCAHLADLHVRSLVRHNEIKTVIDALVADVIKYKIDAVFIAGDIWHHKTMSISPEAIDEIANLFKSILEVTDLYLTLGNHDFNVTNPNRQDAITPIYTLLKQQPLKHRFELFKYSGVYDITNTIKMCVFSIADEHNWDKVQPTNDCINIATYHGALSGATTEVDYTIAEGITVDFFKDYDIVMLGDIHKTQFLGTKNINNKDVPWIGYPGSVLQNTYAEELVHGYFLWDIKSKDDFNVVFKKLPNINPFITISWLGNVKSTIEQIQHKNARYRIKSDVHIAHKDSETLINVLHNDFDALEVVFKNDVNVSKQLLNSKENEQVITDNFRDPKALTHFIQKFHSNEVFDVDSLQSLEKLVKKYLHAAIEDDDISRHTHWSLNKLKFSNVFSYGQNNIIDFENLHGFVGIFGPNKIGKSSIPGALMYGLFNSSDRGSIKNLYICNQSKDTCSVEVDLSINNTKYVFVRQTVKKENKRGETNAITTLSVDELLPDGTKKDLIGDGRIETDKIIRRLIGSGEDFEIAHLSSQGNSDVLLKHKSTERLNYLAKILDIDIFAKMHRLVNDDLKTYKAQLKAYPNKEWAKLAKDLKQQLSDIKTQIENKTQIILDNREQIIQCEKQLSVFKNTDTPSEEQIQNLQNKINKNVVKKSNLESELDEQKNLQTDIQNKLDIVTAKLQIYNIEKLNVDLNDLRERQTKFSKLESQSNAEQQKVDLIEKSKKLLQIVPCENSFPTCQFIKSANEDKDKYAEQCQKLDVIKQQLLSEQTHIKKIVETNIEEQIKQYNVLQKSFNELKFEFLQKDTKIVNIKHELQMIFDQLVLDGANLQKLKEIFDATTANTIHTLKNTIDTCKTTISTLDVEKLTLATNQGKFESSILKLLEEKRTRDLLTKDMKNLELIAQAFSKKGIPRVVISTQLPLINIEISKILDGIVDFTIEFKEDDDTDKLDIFINYGGNKRILELGSGMEKLIASIAIRVALINVSSLPKADFFIIDEGFGSLDDNNIEACIKLLKSLTHYFKSVIVISHVDSIKDAVDSLIEVTKNGEDSSVVYE